MAFHPTKQRKIVQLFEGRSVKYRILTLWCPCMSHRKCKAPVKKAAQNCLSAKLRSTLPTCWYSLWQKLLSMYFKYTETDNRFQLLHMKSSWGQAHKNT
jgi:hypothetical protein